MAERDRRPIEVAYERRNRDLDPQLFWRGKDEQNWPDLVVQAPPLFIQEKVHPKALIADLLRQTKDAEAERAANKAGFQANLFADFNGLPDPDARTEFYQRDANWSNRMILGDSLQVWWEARIARQQKIDASIAATADFEYLYDRPYEDRKKVRVAGPFTVESISPHRVLGVDENDELIDRVAEARASYGTTQDFGTVIPGAPQNVRRPASPQGGPDSRSRRSPPGRASSSARTGGTSKAVMRPLPRSAPPSSSAPSSVPSPAPTSWPPPGRRPMPASTCWSPARSTTRPSPRSSRSSAAFPSSRPA